MKSSLFLACSFSFMLTGCSNLHHSGDEHIRISAVKMHASSQSSASGEVKFLYKENMTEMEAYFSGLKPGIHAIHLHANADCSSDDAKSAGGHWNPTNEKHGQWGDENGFHRGDVGNFKVGSNGEGKLSMMTGQWCVGCDDPSKNILGKSVIVHQGTDDFETQPTGDAGIRVACGEITE